MAVATRWTAGDPTRAALSAYLAPVFSVPTGALILVGTLIPGTLAGLGLILTGSQFVR